MKRKTVVKRNARRVHSKPALIGKEPTLGARITEGLEQAVAWSRGEDVPVRVTWVQIPEVDVREVRRQMGLSQTQFAMKFGFPPATLRNWEQGRVRPDASTRVCWR